MTYIWKNDTPNGPRRRTAASIFALHNGGLLDDRLSPSLHRWQVPRSFSRRRRRGVGAVGGSFAARRGNTSNACRTSLPSRAGERWSRGVALRLPFFLSSTVKRGLLSLLLLSSDFRGSRNHQVPRAAPAKPPQPQAAAGVQGPLPPALPLGPEP